MEWSRQPTIRNHLYAESHRDSTHQKALQDLRWDPHYTVFSSTARN